MNRLAILQQQEQLNGMFVILVSIAIAVAALAAVLSFLQHRLMEKGVSQGSLVPDLRFLTPGFRIRQEERRALRNGPDGGVSQPSAAPELGVRPEPLDPFHEYFKGGLRVEEGDLVFPD